jgi:hypothetical protein
VRYDIYIYVVRRLRVKGALSLENSDKRFGEVIVC